MDWAVRFVVFPIFALLLGSLTFVVLSKITHTLSDLFPTWIMWVACKLYLIQAFEAFLSGYIAAWAISALLRFWRG
jgi:hypothetical protein